MKLLAIHIERKDHGYTVTTSEDGGNGWGVGITFLTLDRAKLVASAIAQAAEADTIGIYVSI
jgi:hypothetical protein